MAKINQTNFTEEFNEELDTLGGSGELTFPIGDVTALTASGVGTKVVISWKDPEDLIVVAEDGTDITMSEWAGTKIVRKLGAEPTKVDDGELVIDSKVRNLYSVSGFEDANITEGNMYFYRAFPYTVKDIVTNGSSVSIIVQKNTGPGPGNINGGNLIAGFFGEVPAAEFITGDALSTAVGLTAGTSQFSNEPWLKFSLDGKILFVAKRPLRHTISWDHLKASDLIVGNKTIKIGNLHYKVRLIRGSLINPANTSLVDGSAKGSEWNRLMIPIISRPSGHVWRYPQNVEVDAPTWGTGYISAEVGAGSTYNGFYTWCQENIINNLGSGLQRGLSDVSGISSQLSHTATVQNGWRPVLELIDPLEYDDNSGAPGSPKLVAGDKTTGFFGEVPNPQLITPEKLATAVGLVAGALYNPTTPWLKFALDGKIVFVPKTPIRSAISWNSLNIANLINGKKVIMIGGLPYRVRLMKGSTVNPHTQNEDFINSEWNRLMLPIHIKVNDKNWSYPAHVGDNVPNWNIGYDNNELQTNSEGGTWCQEGVNSSTTWFIIRGVRDISGGNSQALNTGMMWRPVLELIDQSEYDDVSGTPGSPKLIGGDMTAGFFGEIPNTEFITPVELTKQTELTSGSPIGDTSPWLKFAIDGKVIFITKIPIREKVAWDRMDRLGLTTGGKVLRIGAHNYKVRLIRGSFNNPSTQNGPDKDAKGSEWNRLMYPIHINAKTKVWNYPENVEANVPDWGIGYTDDDLRMSTRYGESSYNWCQEKSLNNNIFSIARGAIDPSHTSLATANHAIYGWRPVLELIQ